MTTQGKALALCAFLAAVAGAFIGSRPAIVAAFALAFLFAADGLMWLLMRRAAAALSAVRTLGQMRDHAVAFAGHSVDIAIEIANTSRMRIEIALRDLVPRGLRVEGAASWVGELAPAGTARCSYRVRAEGLALIQIPGFALTITSPAGLWRATRFVALHGTLRVVPDIFAKHFLQPWRKDVNTLLRHGRHMQRRAGFGAELLSLRAYQEGDPLKSIAWRASARRDALLVKEFESEVPVRARLLLGPSLRFYAGADAPIKSAVVFCARLARVLAEQRDLVEVIIARPDRITRTGLGLTRRHMGAMLNALGDAAACPPPLPLPLAPPELETVLAAALCTTPDLADATRTVRSRRLTVGLSAADRNGARAALALFLSTHFNLGIGALPLLARDDALLGFFARAYMPAHPTLQANEITHAWATIEAPSWAQRLSRMIGRLIAHAQDEELFVVMADVAVLPDDELGHLVETLLYARARGHRVVLLWPEIAPPGGGWKDLFARRSTRLAATRSRLRGRGIPAHGFTAARGFLPVLRQLALLRRAQGVARW